MYMSLAPLEHHCLFSSKTKDYFSFLSTIITFKMGLNKLGKWNIFLIETV